MSLRNIIIYCLWDLSARRKKYIAAAAGVMAGILCMLMTMSIVIAQKARIESDIKRNGDLHLISVYNGLDERGNTLYINDDAVKQFESIDHVSMASPIYTFSLPGSVYNFRGHVVVQAMNAEVLKYKQIVSKEYLRDQNLVFFGSDKGFEHLWDGTVSLGEYEKDNGKVAIDLYVYFDYEAYLAASNNKGAYPPKYNIELIDLYMDDNSSGVYADIDSVKESFKVIYTNGPWPNEVLTEDGRRITPMPYDEAVIVVDDIEYAQDIIDIISEMGYRTRASIARINDMRKQTDSMELLYTGITAIVTLIAIAITAIIMIINVYERKHEIGVLKLIGFSTSDIADIFMCSSLLTGLAGGFAAMVLSVIISFVTNELCGRTVSLIPFWLLSIAVILSGFISLIGGAYPAKKAALESTRSALDKD